jgi:DNA-binding transcriptional ArsR family regulator
MRSKAMSRQPNLVTRGLVLDALRKHPGATYRELASMVGVKSVSVISYHVKELQANGSVHRGCYRSQRTTTARAETSAKKSAGGRKSAQQARILDKKVAGLDAATWARIEKIGRREDDRKKKAHSVDVVFDFHTHGAQDLHCTKLG